MCAHEHINKYQTFNMRIIFQYKLFCSLKLLNKSLEIWILFSIFGTLFGIKVHIIGKPACVYFANDSKFSAVASI